MMDAVLENLLEGLIGKVWTGEIGCSVLEDLSKDSLVLNEINKTIGIPLYVGTVVRIRKYKKGGRFGDYPGDTSTFEDLSEFYFVNLIADDGAINIELSNRHSPLAQALYQAAEASLAEEGTHEKNIFHVIARAYRFYCS